MQYRHVEHWLSEHTRPQEIPQSTVDYLQNLVPSCRKTVIQFPPSCVVRAKPGVTLHCPAPGTYGIVASYTMDGSEVKVVPNPTDDKTQYAGLCRPDDLDVIGYWRGLTPEKVQTIYQLGSIAPSVLGTIANRLDSEIVQRKPKD